MTDECAHFYHLTYCEYLNVEMKVFTHVPKHVHIIRLPLWDMNKMAVSAVGLYVLGYCFGKH